MKPTLLLLGLISILGCSQNDSPAKLSATDAEPVDVALEDAYLEFTKTVCVWGTRFIDVNEWAYSVKGFSFTAPASEDQVLFIRSGRYEILSIDRQNDNHVDISLRMGIQHIAFRIDGAFSPRMKTEVGLARLIRASGFMRIVAAPGDDPSQPLVELVSNKEMVFSLEEALPLFDNHYFSKSIPNTILAAKLSGAPIIRGKSIPAGTPHVISNLIDKDGNNAVFAVSNYNAETMEKTNTANFQLTVDFDTIIASLENFPAEDASFVQSVDIADIVKHHLRSVENPGIRIFETSLVETPLNGEDN